ncbi:LLM class flavin-dependent oxidoreductase [Pectobacteriaceae bacterium CE90]|nr:LLM class flavin-dependent oxidoreductase [Pectobacteriaceae bacterium CE90]
MMRAATYADRHGFHAVWTPERHYKDFGGLYPSPSVLSAALAASTQHIQIRAGSVVLPLHAPECVVEEWSVVDNLSGGRVGIAVAAGWNPDDFATCPDRFARRRELLLEKLTEVQRLWRGEPLNITSGKPLRIYPSPIQTELPVWLTSLSHKSFAAAGRLGVNILTGMMEHDIDECAQKIALYRETRAAHGHDPATGKVTVMLHTYIGDDEDEVKAQVKAPMLRYLHAFVAAGEAKLQADSQFASAYSHEQTGDRDALLNYTFERYFATRALMGTPAVCKQIALRLKNSGVDEIACLLDFGLDSQTLFRGIEKLSALKALLASASLQHSLDKQQF